MTTSLTLNFHHIFYCLFSHLQRLKSLCVHSLVIVFILSSRHLYLDRRGLGDSIRTTCCAIVDPRVAGGHLVHIDVKMMHNLLSSKDNYICQVDGGRGEGIRSIPELAIVPEVLWVISASN